MKDMKDCGQSSLKENIILSVKCWYREMCKNILHILHNSPKMAVLAPQWIIGVDYRGQVIDLFLKDENKETEVTRLPFPFVLL